MTTDVPSTNVADREPTWFVSVAFWFTLFVAATLYAAISLAPKLERLLVLERQHREKQWQLVDLEQQVQQLGKVAAALEEDPKFAAEVARSRFSAVENGETSISLSDELQIGFQAPRQTADVQLPWYYGLVRQFATNNVLRWGLLGFSALLVLLSFSFLHARYATQVQANVQRLGGVARRVGRRYQSTAGE